MASHWLTWAIACASILGVIARPRGTSEALWAGIGAIALVVFSLLPASQAFAAVLAGTDVYLFLTGMMLLAELAREEELFDWLAAYAVRHAGGSASRLFLLVYGVGTLVTIFLSNDATAVVLTPAVYAAAKRADSAPLPYLFACAFIANAASFVLPISNPANLVVFGDKLPALTVWLGQFGASAVASILLTYAALRVALRAQLRERVRASVAQPDLGRPGRIAAAAIALTAIVLLVCSGLSWRLGLPTFIAGCCACLLISSIKRQAPTPLLRHISWSVLPLVAGLFVLVKGVEQTGVLSALPAFVSAKAAMAPVATAFGTGMVVALAGNLVNNLPMGLFAGAAGAHWPHAVKAAVLVGVDLGPNLSVTGSLATLLWLIAIRREGANVSGWRFLALGAVVMPPALLGALALTSSAASAADVGPDYGIEMSRMIPVRDGTSLEAWITKPSSIKAKLPTILTLTQYDIDGGRHGDSAGYYAGRGYAFVQAYVRGRGQSGGLKQDNLGTQVGRDGYDLVEWIAAQPWSDGRVVMFGGSFVGMTQWQTAAQLPPHLAGIAPYVPIYPGWDIPNTNGIPQAWTTVILGYTAGRSLNSGFIEDQDYWQGKMLEQYAAYRPFYQLSDAIGISADDWWMLDAQGNKQSMFGAWLDHVGDAAFNLAAEPKAESYQRMNFPVLTVTGYYDDDQPGALHYYRNYLAHAPAGALAQLHLVIGPWDHSGAQRPSQTIEGVPIPQAAVIDMQKLHADWYDHALGRGPLPPLLHAAVAYFMLGADEWRYAKTLDSASSGKTLTLFLADSSGTPQDVFRSGQLTLKPRTGEPPAGMVSDPHELPELALAKYAADEDLRSQFRAFQQRAITFHSDPFPQDTEIAGHMRLTLECAVDAPDFDLWAQVLMVLPDGSTVRLGEDIRRARFRNSQFKQELVKPGQMIRIPFEFNWLARRIPAGARLRLTIAPLNSPNYQKNFNSGGRIGYENIDAARIANIKIFHDAQRPSQLTLPLAAPRDAGL